MQDQKLACILVPIFLSFFTIIAIVLRLFARRIKQVSLGLDDWTILAALASLPRLEQALISNVGAGLCASWFCL